MKRLQQFSAIFVMIILLLAAAPITPAHAARHIQMDSLASDLLLQFKSGGHILGFHMGEYYLTDTTYALHVQFVGAKPVPPQSNVPAASAERGAPPLQRVTYENLWDRITLTYEPVSDGLVRSTYRLEPGADSRTIRLRYNIPVTLNADGTLTLTFSTGQMTESAPIAWQEIDGQRIPVSIGFDVFESEVGFRLGAYDPAYPLFIDPTITWNTFLGGAGDDWTNGGIALDGSGNLYVTGYSTATWQGAAAPRRAHSGDYDAFAAKLDASGGLVWNTFLGGIGIDIGEGIAVDGSGNVYVTGYSDASWQGTTPPRRDYMGNDETFAAKLDANGDLVWNTFLGPGGDDYGSAIAVDGSGNVYVTGESSATWQETTAPQRAYSGGYDAVASKLNTSGDLLWHTFLGGGGDDFGRGIAVDGSGNVYVTGYSSATWQGGAAPRRGFSSGVDAFAAKLDAGGNLTWNTFLGGTDIDNGEGIAVDGSGNVYVTGHSRTTWTGTTAPRHTFSGNVDAFAAKLDTSGDLTWNTFLGGSSNDFGFGIAVDGSGNVYVTGASNTTWQGATPPQPAYSGNYDAFAAQLDPSGDLAWNAFLGAGSEDYGFGIAADGSSNVYVTGYSNTTWQGTTAPQRSYSGGFDVFAAKLSPPSNNANLSNLVLSSGTLNPAFASATTSYTAGVAYGVASLTVTPTAADAAATITVNGTPVASGSASGAISLNVGANTITIIVTAEDGVTTKTYTVVVTRACAGAITVTNANDSGAGSLRETIADVCPGGTITFDNDHTIALASQLAINKSLTIDGAGHAVVASGNNAVRVFYISGGTVTLNNLTIQNGRNVPTIPTNIGGAGLFVDTGAAVTLNNCAVLNNATNASPTVGGGIVVNTGASLTMNNCTVSGNSSSFDGGGVLNLGTLNVNNATLVNNTTPGAGGGLETASGTTTLRNTIIAGNSGASGPDCYTPGGTTQSAGYNMVGSTFNCVITPNASDVKGFSYASLLLGPLQNNGGPNSTYALLPGSPAIDAIPGCNGAPATDQRGIARPQGENCDIGAFELVDNTAPSLTSFTYQNPAASPTNADTLVFRVTFSEPMKNVDTTDFSVNSTSTATVTAVNQVTTSTYNVTVSGGDLAGYTGDVGLNLSGTQDIEDYVGNNLPAGEPATDQVYVLDNAGPTITINNPTTIPATSKTIIAGISDGTLTMSVKPPPADTTCDDTLTFIAYSAQTFSAEADNGTRICYRAVDALGNTSYSLSNPIAGIDTTPPTVTIDSISPDPTNAGTTVSWHADEDGTYSVRVGGTDCTTGMEVVTGAYTAPGTVNTNLAAGDLTLGVNTIYVCVTDAATNTGSANGSVTQDSTTPSLTSFTRQNPAASPTNIDTLVFRATFSEGVQNVDAGDFFVNSTSTAGITAVDVVDAPTNSIYDITVSGGDLDMFNGTVGLDVMPATDGLDITDMTGNPLSDDEPATDEIYDVDNTSAAVTSVLRQNPLANPTNLPSVTFRVTFAEDVQNVDTTDFSLATTGTATGTVNAIVVQSASVYDVVITGVGGNGVLDLNFTAGNNIADLLSNPIGASPAVGTEEAYTIDTTYPTVVFGGSTAPANNSILTSGPTQIVVEFNKDVLADGSPNAANTLANYLLVAAGVNGTFNTLTCGGVGGGLQPDDTHITINSITYSNGGGAGPFVATLNINGGMGLPVGDYRLFICGTSSIYDPAGNRLNNGLDSTVSFNVRAAVAPVGNGDKKKAGSLPSTGFAPDQITLLPPQSVPYSELGELWVEIPKLGVKMPIVGIPQKDGNWDVSWLGTQAGWLEGSAYPSWNGNSVITGHVWNADNSAGPFRYLNTLWWGDKIIIHVAGKQYIYEVRAVKEVAPTNVSAMMKHEELPWLTLITCKGYDEKTNNYRSRILVRAVLIEVK